nr:MAG TPA: hypothetical protein [Bacteriophage sp.]
MFKFSHNSSSFHITNLAQIVLIVNRTFCSKYNMLIGVY